MNKEKSGNFWEGLHITNYLQPYQSKFCEADSLITVSNGSEELLNGLWNYCPDPYDWGLRDKWFAKLEWTNHIPHDHNFIRWPQINIPSCWNTQKEEFFWYENTMCYYREFDFQFHKDKEERIFLKFDGVQYATYIFLNGEYLAYHLGGSTPFNVELKKALKEGKNQLIVFVENRRSVDRVPMDNTDWFNYGGIYRDVSLLRMPNTFIQSYMLNLVPNSNYSQIKLELLVNNYQESKKCILKIDGLLEKEIELCAINNEAILDINPELWSPENPKLYDVTLIFGDQIIKDQIGFREIKIEETNILLNGVPIYLKGVCIHEDSVKNGKSVTEKEVRENYRLIKEMNGNFARLSHYPHSEVAARIADEMGILLWEEIPVYWAINFSNKNTFFDANNQLKELIYRDRNRASVIIWSVGNENEDTDDRLNFMKSLVNTIKQIDHTRLISAACLVNFKEGLIEDRLLDFIDIIGVNEYFGWYYSDFEGLKKMFELSPCKKPVIIAEFGASARANHYGTERELFTETQQEWVYKNQVELFMNTNYIKGVAPWILFDFRTPHRMNHLQEGFNRKGLLSETKQHKKKAFYVMQKFYKEWNVK